VEDEAVVGGVERDLVGMGECVRIVRRLASLVAVGHQVGVPEMERDRLVPDVGLGD
jgi:hypothetical protein